MSRSVSTRKLSSWFVPTTHTDCICSSRGESRYSSIKLNTALIKGFKSSSFVWKDIIWNTLYEAAKDRFGSSKFKLNQPRGG